MHGKPIIIELAHVHTFETFLCARDCHKCGAMLWNFIAIKLGYGISCWLVNWSPHCNYVILIQKIAFILGTHALSAAFVQANVLNITCCFARHRDHKVRNIWPGCHQIFIQTSETGNWVPTPISCFDITLIKSLNWILVSCCALLFMLTNKAHLFRSVYSTIQFFTATTYDATWLAKEYWALQIFCYPCGLCWGENHNIQGPFWAW